MNSYFTILQGVAPGHLLCILTSQIMSNTTFTRQELYDLVWSKPVIHIAKNTVFQTTVYVRFVKSIIFHSPNLAIGLS